MRSKYWPGVEPESDGKIRKSHAMLSLLRTQFIFVTQSGTPEIDPRQLAKACFSNVQRHKRVKHCSTRRVQMRVPILLSRNCNRSDLRSDQNLKLEVRGLIPFEPQSRFTAHPCNDQVFVVSVSISGILSPRSFLLDLRRVPLE